MYGQQDEKIYNGHLSITRLNVPDEKDAAHNDNGPIADDNDPVKRIENLYSRQLVQFCCSIQDRPANGT